MDPVQHLLELSHGDPGACEMPAPPGTAPSPPEGSAPEAPAPQLEGDSLEHAGSWPRVTGNTRLTKQEGQRPIRGKVTVPLEGRQQQETGLGAEGSSPEVGGRPATDACLQNLGWCCHALRGSYLATLLPKRFITKTLIMLALRGGAFSSFPTPTGTPGAADRGGAARAPTLSVRSAQVQGRGWAGLQGRWGPRARGKGAASAPRRQHPGAWGQRSSPGAAKRQRWACRRATWMDGAVQRAAHRELPARVASRRLAGRGSCGCGSPSC